MPACLCVRRGMSVEVRAAKIADLWKHMTWLDEHIDGDGFLTGDHLTLADLTWFPTFVFMEFLLPRVFGWDDILNQDKYFPNIHRCYTAMKQHPAMDATRTDIWEYWEDMEKAGQFEPIIEETKLSPSHKWLYTDVTDAYLRLQYSSADRNSSCVN